MCKDFRPRSGLDRNNAMPLECSEMSMGITVANRFQREGLSALLSMELTDGVISRDLGRQSGGVN